MMLCAFFIAVAAQAKIGPALPAGCDTRFQEACLAVEQRLEAGDFEGAKPSLTLLPTTTVRIAWDDAAVPADLKARFAKARDRAIAAWKRALPTLDLSVGDPAAIRVSFVESIEKQTGDLLKPGARHKLGAAGEPRVQTTIALTRATPAVPANDKDVQNEVAYAVGSYLGLAPSPLYSHIMGRTDLSNVLVCLITADEKAWAAANLEVARTLREACQNEVRLTPAKSQIDVKGPEPKDTAVTQGAKPVYKFTIANKGNVDLNYRIASTCACLVTDADKKIAPGQSRTIAATLDTTEFTGELVKHLYVYSNDPVQPVIEMPIRSQITPRYRFLAPSGDIVLLEDGEAGLAVYLTFPAGQALTPLAAYVDGVKGTVSMTPWKGTLPDPDFNEGPKERSGYKLTVKLPTQPLYGRMSGAILVATDDVLFDKLQFSFWVQKGIVPLPMPLYLGSELSKTPTQAEVIVSRPGKPFKITSISSDLACLSATAEPIRGEWEYKLIVRYDGSAKAGPLKGILDVRTDDPKQPIVKVAVVGAVR
jgi:hypothetical protein